LLPLLSEVKIRMTALAPWGKLQQVPRERKKRSAV
jgi:hypothetical protein